MGASYLFLIQDNKILLQRRFQTGFEDGKYGVPAGHLDGGESAKQGCIREMKEEINITIDSNDLQVVHVMHRNAAHDERIDFFMVASEYSGEIKNNEPNKCDDLSWFGLDDLPENMVEYVRSALEEYKKGNLYSEYGWHS